MTPESTIDETAAGAPAAVFVLERLRRRPDFLAAARGRVARRAGFVLQARDRGMEQQGYRMLANIGQRAGQEVPHLHVHLFAGEPLGPMLCK